jgi:hypothetical protein
VPHTKTPQRRWGSAAYLCAAPRFFQRQFSPLYALVEYWRLPLQRRPADPAPCHLRHAICHGVQFDFTYTFSNSIDLGSDMAKNIHVFYEQERA